MAKYIDRPQFIIDSLTVSKAEKKRRDKYLKRLAKKSVIFEYTEEGFGVVGMKKK